MMNYINVKLSFALEKSVKNDAIYGQRWPKDKGCCML